MSLRCFNRRIVRVTLLIAAGVALAAMIWSWGTVNSPSEGMVAAKAAARSLGGCSVPSFGDATSYPAGGNPASVKIGDFNNDGNPDVAVADYISDEAGVLLGDGNGGFGPLSTFPVGTSPSGIALGDFNLDGKLDIVTANYRSANVSVLLGNGSGGSGPATNYAVQTNTRSVAVGDFNKDGKPDLAVGNTFSNQVSVLLGN